MPPKKSASSSSKRKASPTSDGEAETTASRSQVKKAKVSTAGKSETPEGFAANGQPTNKVLPVNIQFPVKNAGTIRIASWNVSGLSACQKKVRICLTQASISPSSQHCVDDAQLLSRRDLNSM